MDFFLFSVRNIWWHSGLSIGMQTENLVVWTHQPHLKWKIRALGPVKVSGLGRCACRAAVSRSRLDGSGLGLDFSLFSYGNNELVWWWKEDYLRIDNSVYEFIITWDLLSAIEMVSEESLVILNHWLYGSNQSHSPVLILECCHTRT